jgi:hypothetical protein
MGAAFIFHYSISVLNDALNSCSKPNCIADPVKLGILYDVRSEAELRNLLYCDIPLSMAICWSVCLCLQVSGLQFGGIQCTRETESWWLNVSYRLDCMYVMKGFHLPVVKGPRGPGFDSRRYQIFWAALGLERGPLSPCEDKWGATWKKSSGSGLENWD